MELSGPYRPMFYAQSWLLVHYLIRAREDHDFSRDTAAYLRAVEAGTPAREAFEEAYGVTVAGLDRRLARYASRELKYRHYELRNPLPDAELQMGLLAPHAVASRLGQIALEFDAALVAQRYFEQATATAPDDPRVLAGLGVAHRLQGRFEEAEPLLLRAVELGPEDAMNHLDLAELYHDRADATEDQTPDREFLRLARQSYVRAHRLQENHPEVLAMYGSTFVLPGEDPTEGLDALETAHDLLPSNSEVKWHLASLYVRLGRTAEARRLLRVVIAWSHGEADEARALLAELEGDTVASDEGRRAVE